MATSPTTSTPNSKPTPYYNLNEYSGKLYDWSVSKLSPDNLLWAPVGLVALVASAVCRVVEGVFMSIANGCLMVYNCLCGSPAASSQPDTKGANGPEEPETGLKVAEEEPEESDSDDELDLSAIQLLPPQVSATKLQPSQPIPYFSQTPVDQSQIRGRGPLAPPAPNLSAPVNPQRDRPQPNQPELVVQAIVPPIVPPNGPNPLLQPLLTRRPPAAPAEALLPPAAPAAVLPVPAALVSSSNGARQIFSQLAGTALSAVLSSPGKLLGWIASPGCRRNRATVRLDLANPPLERPQDERRDGTAS
jgi:hypothetical protein